MIPAAVLDASPEQFRPSTSQLAAWQGWVIGGNGVDEEGFWQGWCPLHDADNDDDAGHSALFNFASGSYRCLGAPSCHEPKRAMTLYNLAARMRAEGIDERGESYLQSPRRDRERRRQENRVNWAKQREEERKSKLAAAQAKYGPQSVKPHTDAE